MILLSSSAQATRRIGFKLGRLLSAGAVVALEGDLGSGKTTFVQGLARGLGVKNPKEVRSPTFALIQEHVGKIPLCHVDLYRLSHLEIKQLGLEEYLRQDSSRDPRWVVAIEWAEKAKGWISSDPDFSKAIPVRFEFLSRMKRRITISGGKDWKEIERRWKRTEKF